MLAKDHFSYHNHYITNTSNRFNMFSFITRIRYIRVITKLPNSEQSYKGKVKTHNYINSQNQSTTGKLSKP
jgi:hypothetical protein